MKKKEHFKLFFRDHLWLILLFLIAPVGFMGIYCWIYGRGEIDFFYYLFLAFFVLLIFLSYRCYSTWNLYEMLLGSQETLDDFLLPEIRSREEEQYQKVIKKLRQISSQNLKDYEEERKNHTMMIYRWVHQIKTPLSVIRLIADEQKGQEEFLRIDRSVQKIQYDLDQILNMYKLDAIKNDFHAEKIYLHELARTCINEQKDLFIQNRIYPKIQIDPNLFIYSDGKWMKVVLDQLFTNAIKYSDPEKQVLVSAWEEERENVLCVKDSGCGIESGDLDRIFELFFTGQNGRLRGESSGLGLYMVKRILDYMGHEITVSSKEGAGSELSIRFQK